MLRRLPIQDPKTGKGFSVHRLGLRADTRPLRGSYWTLAVAALLLGFVVAYVLWVNVYYGPLREEALDLMNIFPPLAVAVLCLLAFYRAGKGRVRWFWALIGLAHLSAALAESTWAFYEIALHIEAPFPSTADLYWLLFYPFSLAGIFVLVSWRGGGKLSTAATVLDALLFAAAAAAVLWGLVIQPALDPEAGLLANAVTVFYPAGDVLLLVGLLSLALGRARVGLPKGIGWLSFAFVVTFAADIGYSIMENAGTYRTGSWVDPLWPLAYVAAGLAALAYLHNARSHARSAGLRGALQESPLPTPFETAWQERARVWLPYLVVPSAGILLFEHFFGGRGSGSTEDVVVVVSALGLVLLVLLRQLVVVAEKRRLETSLTRLSKELEAQVVKLDAEQAHLAQLNAVAIDIAHCRTRREVQDAGLGLACRVMGCDAAALWLRPIGSRPQLIGSKGLPRAGRRQIQDLLATSGVVKAAMSSGMPAWLEATDDAGKKAGPLSGSFAEVAIVPLISRQLTLGALCLGYPSPGQLRSEQDSSLAMGVASQIAVALENARRYDDAHFLAERDSLTGLLNHRGINDRLEQEVARAQRAGSTLGIVMMDVDDFKLFNDVYGHVTGDRVLQEVARILSVALRRCDVVGRNGGDEFIALLPDADSDSALALIARLQGSLKNRDFTVEGGQNIPIKMSYGIATYPFDGRKESELLAAADANLYRSKRKGGDQATASGGDKHRRNTPIGVFTVLDGLVTTVDNKDRYTRKHSDDVTEYSLALASKLRLSMDTQRSLRIAGLLHDVGKVGVPDHILRKPASLSKTEFEAIKQHVNLGKMIINEIPNLKEVLSAVATHHERYDGQGYPQGISGEDIPLLGRILAVTDAYSAMTSDRPYRKALTEDEARAELRRVSGSQLDPDVVSAFLEILEESEAPESGAVEKTASA
jgi:diguanylate cyclase (GGDEF)-like protein/putative nucleotidyltransferase with HDIG domain